MVDLRDLAVDVVLLDRRRPDGEPLELVDVDGRADLLDGQAAREPGGDR